jgi:hypothetical protein
MNIPIHAHSSWKTFLSIAVLLLACAGAADAAAEDSKFKFTAEGAYASAGLSDGCVFASLWVARGGSSAAPETYLSYSVYDGCAGVLLAEGWGPIANSAFKTTSKGARLRLRVGVSDTFSSSGEIGLIDITWLADRSVSWRSESRVEFRSPTQRYRQRGRSEENPATATGTLIVTTFAGGSGYVGTNRGLVREELR